MEYLGNILCIEFSELVPVIMTKPNFHYHRDNNNLIAHGSGGNGRTVLIEYETMPAKFKEAVVKYYGCPYNYVAKQPILKALGKDHKAYKFFHTYVLPNGALLPSSDYSIDGKPQINYVARYTENANWLNLFSRLTHDKATLKRELNN